MSSALSTSRRQILIRPASSGDALAYRELRLEALRNHPTAFGADYEENLLFPPEHWQKRVEINGERETLMLAEHQGQLVGMPGFYRSLGRKDRHAGYIWGVFVREPWRGIRLADALINACLDWARGKEMVIARLAVAVDNQPAIRCYERCGFKVYGTEEKSIFYEGQFVDEYLMARLLKDV